MPLEYQRPSVELGLELEEVAAKALALRDYLKAPNIPLDGFPSERLTELCGALASLPRGTAEGCRAPLTYARIELPRIRRKYISRAPAPKPDGETPPSVEREDRLDLLLKDLFASVSTALAQYQVEAAVELPDGLEPEPTFDATKLDAAAIALQRSKSVDDAIQEARPPVEELRRADFPHAENLSRQLNDVETNQGAVRAELKSEEAQISQLEMLSAAVRRLADVLENTGVAIERAAQFARAADKISKPLRDLARKTRKEISDFLIIKVEEFGKAIQETAHVLRQWAPGKPAKRPDDFDYDKIKEMILAGRAPPAKWRPWINDLVFTGETSLKTLAPLAGLTALQSLSLEGTEVSDLAPLANLSALQGLYLQGTQVSDLKPLAGLSALQTLDLQGTQVSDLAPLAGLSALQELYLHGTQVSDLAPLAGLAALQRLDLQGTQVSDLKPLAGLAELKVVRVENEFRRTALARTLGRRGSIVQISAITPWQESSR